MAISGIHTGDITTNSGHAIVGNDNQIIQNFYHSASYQTMESQRQQLLACIEKYPDDTDFQRELARLLQQMEDFKRDVLKLSEDFQRIPLNTERLKLAKQHFEAGEYVQARAVLDAESISQEQDALLTKQQRLQEEQATIAAQLDDKANEWLLKARLTAIDYSLGEQRIAQTSRYFENALKSGRTPDRLFDYASFLQENNQYHTAEDLYSEVLASYRQLAKDNSTIYLPSVASTLNNLGNLIAVDNQRFEQAEQFLSEALSSYRQLSENQATVYLPDVAMTLTNLGHLVAQDSQWRNEAENLYKEALSIRRQLAKDNPTVYLTHVANTLNNLAILVAVDSQRRNEAENLYKEALSIRRQFAKNNPTVYHIAYLAAVLNNLGLLVAVDSQRRNEAESLYTEALRSYRQLAKDNPMVYLPDVAMTSNNLGVLMATNKQRRNEAEAYYTEALTIRRQIAKDNPTVYLPDVAMTLINFGNLVAKDSQRRNEAETYYAEALSSYRQLASNNPAVYLPNVANTLGAFGLAFLNWSEPEKALPLLQESAQLFAPFAQQAPNVFGEKYDYTLQLIELAKAAKR